MHCLKKRNILRPHLYREKSILKLGQPGRYLPVPNGPITRTFQVWEIAQGGPGPPACGCRHVGHAETCEALSEVVGTRSARQCFDRLREKRKVQEIGAISLPSLRTVPGGCESYRWETEEVGRLVAAVNEVGGYGNPSSLAAIVGSRTAAQVAAKVRDLVTGGRLVRTGPSSFSLQ